jgi:hypothetical protein
MFVSQMPIFSTSSSPKSNDEQPSVPDQLPESDTPGGLRFPTKSVRTVLLADEFGYETISRDSLTKSPETNALPKKVEGSRYNYKALLGHPVTEDSHIEFANESDTSFPVRGHSFERRPFSTRRVWLIIILVAMIVLVVVLIPVGIGWGNLVTAQTEAS